MHPPNIPAADNTSTALIDFMIGFSNCTIICICGGESPKHCVTVCYGGYMFSASAARQGTGIFDRFAVFTAEEHVVFREIAVDDSGAEHAIDRSGRISRYNRQEVSSPGEPMPDTTSQPVSAAVRSDAEWHAERGLPRAGRTPVEALPRAGRTAWRQAYRPGETGPSTRLIERVARAGFDTLVLTVAVPVSANR